jgi:pimeloyl-ACP methyl ester carboxylesterase
MSLHYTTEGQGTPYVLVHGYPLKADIWQSMAIEGCQLIKVDLTKTIESQEKYRQFTLRDWANAISELVNELGHDKIFYAGHSMGGYIGLEFLNQHEDRLLGLVMVHSAANADSEEKKHARQKSISILEKGGQSALVAEMVKTLFAPNFYETNPEAIRQLANQMLSIKPSTYISYLNAMINRADHKDTLTNAQVPIQWIIGKKDALIPVQFVLEQAVRSKHTDINLIEDVGHMSMIEKPTELCKLLVKFVTYVKSGMKTL